MRKMAEPEESIAEGGADNQGDTEFEFVDEDGNIIDPSALGLSTEGEQKHQAEQDGGGGPGGTSLEGHGGLIGDAGEDAEQRSTGRARKGAHALRGVGGRQRAAVQHGRGKTTGGAESDSPGEQQGEVPTGGKRGRGGGGERVRLSGRKPTERQLDALREAREKRREKVRAKKEEEFQEQLRRNASVLHDLLKTQGVGIPEERPAAGEQTSKPNSDTTSFVEAFEQVYQPADTSPPPAQRVPEPAPAQEVREEARTYRPQVDHDAQRYRMLFRRARPQPRFF